MKSPIFIGGRNRGGGTASALTKNIRNPSINGALDVGVACVLPSNAANLPRLSDAKMQSSVEASLFQRDCICSSTSMGGMNLWARVVDPTELSAAAPATERPGTDWDSSPFTSSPSSSESSSSSDIGSESSPSSCSRPCPGSRL